MSNCGAGCVGNLTEAGRRMFIPGDYFLSNPGGVISFLLLKRMLLGAKGIATRSKEATKGS